MATHRFLHYDVFTSEVLAGNQLAVFPESASLSAEQMQRIAREMNFSETTFVLPASAPGSDAKVRIFTPGTELPMAGHPTIGTTFALAEEGAITPGRASVTLELGIGPVPVALDWDGDRLTAAWMTQANIQFGSSIDDRAGASAALSLDVAEIDGSLPIQQGTAGVPFTFIPVTTRSAVDRAVADAPGLRAFGSKHGVSTEVFIFTTEPGDPPANVYSRMFAPLFGIPEDPATGSASGPLGAYLVRHGVVDARNGAEIVSLQGRAMGRPSNIRIRLKGTPEDLSVQVGGVSVLAARAELYL